MAGAPPATGLELVYPPWSAAAGSRQISGAAAPTSAAAVDHDMSNESEGNDDAMSPDDERDAARRRDAADNRASYKARQSLQRRHEKHIQRWGHRSSSLCMFVSHLGPRIVSLSRYGAAFRPTAVNASKIVRILDQLRVELQRSVSGLHAQGHRAHDARNADLQGRAAAVLSEGGPAQAALLHQPAEAAATVLPSQPQLKAELRVSLRPGASRGQRNTRHQQVFLHIFAHCAGP